MAGHVHGLASGSGHMHAGPASCIHRLPRSRRPRIGAGRGGCKRDPEHVEAAGERARPPEAGAPALAAPAPGNQFCHQLPPGARNPSRTYPSRFPEGRKPRARRPYAVPLQPPASPRPPFRSVTFARCPAPPSFCLRGGAASRSEPARGVWPTRPRSGKILPPVFCFFPPSSR